MEGIRIQLIGVSVDDKLATATLSTTNPSRAKASAEASIHIVVKFKILGSSTVEQIRRQALDEALRFLDAA